MKKFIAAAALICITLVLLLEPMGLAWMSDNGLSSPIDIESNVHKSYFESGDGTKDIVRDDAGEIISGPYEIAHPIQLYYFAWLQYLGYFNQDNDEDGTIDTVYFRLSQDIDMKEEDLQFILPPIGSQDNPFLGSFDGEGNTIKNLIVQNVNDGITEAPTTDNIQGVEIVGFFGVIGTLEGDTYSYDTQANEIKNFVLENLTVKTQTANALIGLVAGYVNGLVDCVGVVGSTVDIKAGTTPLSYTGNLSDYSLIGYCTEGFKDEVIVMDIVLTGPDISDPYNVVPDMTGDGEAQGWGGSVAMDDMYNWIVEMRNTATESSDYVYDRVYTTDLNGNKTYVDTTTYKKVYVNEKLGSFVFSPYTANNWGTNYTADFNYLSGGADITEIVYAYGSETTAYLIKDDSNNYITVNNGAISSTTDVNAAAKWIFSNGASGGTAYTVYDGFPYYLTANNATLSLSDFTTASPTSWTISNNTISYSSGYGGNYYLVYNNGWTLSNNISSYKLSNGTTYLSVNGTNVSSTTNVNAAADWFLSNGTSGYLYTVINGTNYYLKTNNSYNQLTMGTSTNRALSYSNGVISYRRNNGDTYYLTYSNNAWGITTTQSSAAAMQLTEIVIQTQTAETTSQTVTRTSTTHKTNAFINSNTGAIQVAPTYFPLTVTTDANGNYVPSDGNTGYIISSSYDTTSSQTYPIRTGDIRISTYDKDSMRNSTTPYTITYKTGNTYETISAVATDPDNLTSDQIASLKSLGLEKYGECYGDYLNSISEACYGLHFMNAQININSIVTAPNATVIKNSYTDYQLPTNCIDFNLAERGFINFVAGTYFSGNDSFFSLHKIERSEDKKTITSIKEIEYIYGYVDSNGNLDPTKPYYYTYKDGTADAGRPSDYSIVFQTSWITHPANLTNNSAYYFEVPVNAGEYALGSVPGMTGAYLVYLDLAANAQLIERTKTYENITEENSEATLPNGVEVLPPSTNGYDANGDALVDADAKDSAFVSINSGTSGSIKFDSTDDSTVTHSATSGTEAEYIGNGTTLKDGNGNEMSMPVSKTTTIERTTYNDYNINQATLVVTVITKTTVVENGVTTVTWTKTVTSTDESGNPVTETVGPQAEELFPETEDTDDSPTTAKGADLLNVRFAYGSGATVTVSYTYTSEGEDENGNATAPVYTVTVTNTTGEAIDLLATLTAEGVSSGITFIITDGTTSTTLASNQTEQTVSIAAAATT